MAAVCFIILTWTFGVGGRPLLMGLCEVKQKITAARSKTARISANSYKY